MFGNAIRRRMKRGLAVCALAAASLGVTQPAAAQFGAMGGSDDVFRPDFTTRDVVLFVENLELDEQQRYLFETLFEMYQMDFQAGVEEVRDKLANMRHELLEGDPQEILEKVFQPVDEWRKKKQALAQRLVLDLQQQLSPQQQDMWPAFDRKLRRIKSLKDGVLTGENIDLFFVVQQLDLTEADEKAIKPILDTYDVSLDAALQARNEFIAKSQNDLSTAIRGQDVATATHIVEQQVNYRLTVRNTTEQAIHDLMAVLPEDTAMRLRRNSLEQAYAQVFRPTQMERVFDEVLKMEDLPQETIEAVVDLESRYDMELSMINERIMAIIREQDGDKAVARVERLVHRVAGQTLAVRKDPVRDEFQKRDELDRQYLRLLRALLSDEQFAMLPVSSRASMRSAAGEASRFGNQPTNSPKEFRGTPRMRGEPVNVRSTGAAASPGGDESGGEGRGARGGASPKGGGDGGDGGRSGGSGGSRGSDD